MTLSREHATITADMPEKKPSNPNEGHRRRLREKFLRSGVSSLNNYEIIELLLTLGTPRTDCKERAKEAIQRFKNLRGVLEASQEELQEVKGIGPNNAFGIRLIREVANEYLKQNAKEPPDCSSSDAVNKYLHYNMQGLKKEVFKVLFLDCQNHLLAIEDMFTGTVNMSAVFTREVIASAIKHHASAVIFVHNHPSGNPCPSKEDREITRELVAAAKLMQIKVQDHVIIGDCRSFSFAGEGLLSP